MTTQIKDFFLYKDEHYELSGTSEGMLFNLTDLKLKPGCRLTSCWRGYQAYFGLSHDAHLMIIQLNVNLDGSPKPKINDINSVLNEKHPFLNRSYEKINYHVKYTGGILISLGFITSPSIYTNTYSAWDHDRVIELLFEDGVLQQSFDRSDQMVDIRRRLVEFKSKSYLARCASKSELKEFIACSFERSYRSYSM